MIWKTNAQYEMITQSKSDELYNDRVDCQYAYRFAYHWSYLSLLLSLDLILSWLPCEIRYRRQWWRVAKSGSGDCIASGSAATVIWKIVNREGREVRQAAHMANAIVRRNVTIKQHKLSQYSWFQTVFISTSLSHSLIVLHSWAATNRTTTFDDDRYKSILIQIHDHLIHHYHQQSLLSYSSSVYLNWHGIGAEIGINVAPAGPPECIRVRIWRYWYWKSKGLT